MQFLISSPITSRKPRCSERTDASCIGRCTRRRSGRRRSNGSRISRRPKCRGGIWRRRHPCHTIRRRCRSVYRSCYRSCYRSSCRSRYRFGCCSRCRHSGRQFLLAAHLIQLILHAWLLRFRSTSRRQRRPQPQPPQSRDLAREPPAIRASAILRFRVHRSHNATLRCRGLHCGRHGQCARLSAHPLWPIAMRRRRPAVPHRVDSEAVRHWRAFRRCLAQRGQGQSGGQHWRVHALQSSELWMSQGVVPSCESGGQIVLAM